MLYWLCLLFSLKVTAVAQAGGTGMDQEGRFPPFKPEIRASMTGSANPAENAIMVTVQEAILMSLENNRSLAVQRLHPEIRETFEQQEEALFDSLVTAQVSAESERGEQLRAQGGREPFDTNLIAGHVAVERFFPAGTAIEVSGAFERLKSSLRADPLAQSRLGLSVTQALLRGRGTEVNLASIRQSRLDTAVSCYELRGFTETLTSLVETSYWDYALATRNIRIVEESLRVAEQQMKETEAMIQVGKLAESELAASEVEIALRRQELINANSTMEITRLRLLRLLHPPGGDPFSRKVVLRSQPDLQQIVLEDMESHVATGLKMRADLNQARLAVERDELEMVKTRSGILPKLDFFIHLGKTGYADAFSGSVGDVSGGSYDALAGIRLEFPLRNRDATARHRRSLLNRDQARRALENLSQLVELDVREAYIEVQRTRQQIAASGETRRLEEEKLRVETEKFRVGRSTNFLVAQAQRDLLLGQQEEVKSVTHYLKALTTLFRLEGSLLERRGVTCPVSETRMSD